MAAAEVTTCFVHGDDLVSRWSYRTAWLLGRQVRCVDRLCCWSSLERGARAFGAKKENTAEVIHGATADFVEWRRRRRDDGEDQVEEHEHLEPEELAADGQHRLQRGARAAVRHQTALGR